MKRIAVIRIRGSIGMRREIKSSLSMLRLNIKNHCVVVRNSPTYVGMLRVVKDYVTWGEINEKTFSELLKKRGRLVGKKSLTEDYVESKTKLNINEFVNEFFNFKRELKDIPGLKLNFRLKPPVGGFERKGVKIPFSLGGALGYRKEKINDLIIKML